MLIQLLYKRERAQVYNLWITRINYVLLEDKMKITILSVGKLKRKILEASHCRI